MTNCHRLKLAASDGKKYLTDVANAETLLRLVQSIPSAKAEPIKLWLAKVGYERMQEMADPARSLDRARETWQKHGYSEKWIQQRIRILNPYKRHLILVTKIALLLHNLIANTVTFIQGKELLFLLTTPSSLCLRLAAKLIKAFKKSKKD